MKIKQFDFASGAVFQKGADTSNPELVGAHIEHIRQRNGGKLAPEDVLADARNPNSPLHTFFEWDDGEAAEQYRLNQARRLIRTIVVTYAEAPEREPQRAYINVRSASEGGSSPSPQAGLMKPERNYVELTEALRQPDTRMFILQQAKRELESWQRRYKDLKEMARIVDKVEALAAALQEEIETEAA